MSGEITILFLISHLEIAISYGKVTSFQDWSHLFNLKLVQN